MTVDGSNRQVLGRQSRTRNNASLDPISDGGRIGFKARGLRMGSGNRVHQAAGLP